MDIAERAASVLRQNDVGHMVTAAPALYPHMWSWDACFIAIGLSHVSVSRAVAEMDTLLSAQWRSGMIPHIVFSSHSDDYFPGAGRWGCAELNRDAPSLPRTSGICQPPVHALAVDAIMRAAAGDPRQHETATAFLDRSWPALLAWHRWLATARDPQREGRVTIYHGWESGMDNSPRWDRPYARVKVGENLPPYTRLDIRHVSDASQRPTDEDYDRYLWLVEEMRAVGYDDDRMAHTMSFAVQDVFFSALLALASDVLADLGSDHGRDPSEVEELRALADRFRRGVGATLHPGSGTARDRDVREDEWLETPTLAVFAPLLCGTQHAEADERLLDLFFSPAWCGHPRLAAGLPPSTSPESALFDRTAYWRGPVWPVIGWLFNRAFQRQGRHTAAQRLCDEGLRLLARGEFGEYYEPYTGRPLGSTHQSWTAAVALDWVRSS